MAHGGNSRPTAALWILYALALLAPGCGRAEPAPDSPIRFVRHDLDRAYGGNGKPGWVRAADLDGDGDLDVVAGGGNALFAYENQGDAQAWTRHGSLDATKAMGANGAVLFDVDGDGDPDVVSARFYGPLGWWENPGGPLASSAWLFHEIAPERWFLHDVIAGDLAGEGDPPDIVANFISKGMESEVRIRAYRPGADPARPWSAQVLEPGREDGRNNHAGIEIADLDQDGHPDLVYSNGWYQAPAAAGGPWVWRPVADLYGISNALARDLGGDRRPDLIVSAGHHGHGVSWLEAPANPRRDPWTSHAIDPDLVHPECLGAADLDRDGDLDLVTCELDFDRWSEPVHAVYLLVNEDRARRWRRTVIARSTDPSHLLQLVDLNGDGRLDILSEATGAPVVTYYENLGPAGP